MPDDVLRFWIEEIQAAQWPPADRDFEAHARARFAPLHVTAVAAELQR